MPLPLTVLRMQAMSGMLNEDLQRRMAELGDQMTTLVTNELENWIEDNSNGQVRAHAARARVPPIMLNAIGVEDMRRREDQPPPAPSRSCPR